MSAFDEKIIGYAEIRNELERIADVLKNPESYTSLGVRTPQAVLLFGEPGVGKTTMAQCLIEESGRKAFVCRKDEPGDEFIKTIKKTFEQAAKEAPSIVFLDDIDKFSDEEGCSRDAEEYVTVQSCIDGLGDCEVFVLATANDVRGLPKSLLREGRFGARLRICTPEGKDSEAIIAKYLSGKNVSDDVDTAFLARVMIRKSCAALEELVNNAGLFAGYDRSSCIRMAHVMRAILQEEFEVSDWEASGYAFDDSMRELKEHIALHEAGHVVVSEALNQGIVTLVSLFGRRGARSDGFTLKCDFPESDTIIAAQKNILASLGGKGAIELVYGVPDCGASGDLDSAFSTMRHLMEDACIGGFGLYSCAFSESQELKCRIEHSVSVEIERCYQRSKEILASNRVLLERIADALLEKGVLTMFDIAAIERDCPVTPAAHLGL